MSHGCKGLDCEIKKIVDIFDFIASKETNKAKLRQLHKHTYSWNPPKGLSLVLDFMSPIGDKYRYCPEGRLDMEWLGIFIGKHPSLECLSFIDLKKTLGFNIEPFFSGAVKNKSIECLRISGCNLILCNLFNHLSALIKASPNVASVHVSSCVMGPEECQSLMLALTDLKRSLKCFELSRCYIGGDYSLEIITSSLPIQSRLEELKLSLDMQRTGFKRLASGVLAVLQLLSLDLAECGLDDERVAQLLDAISGNEVLRRLSLDLNPSITIIGWRRICSEVFGGPNAYSNSSLEELSIAGCGIDDDETNIFASALAGNRTLRILDLSNNHITASGWEAFLPVVCNTSSANGTNQSNHTLEKVGIPSQLPVPLYYLLRMNQNQNKKQVAMDKILMHHNIEVSKELKLNLLPIIIGNIGDASSEGNRMLSAAFTYIRDVPDACSS